jgi:hypothetical protein
MSDAFDALNKQLNAFLDGLETGVMTAVKASPGLIKQAAWVQAKQKFDDSEKLDAWFWDLAVGFEDNILIIEHGKDSDSRYGRDLEEGRPSYNMKEILETSKKAKTSKLGYKYMSIPIKHSPSKKPTTDKGREIQDRINQVLKDPVYALAKISSSGGAVVSTEALVTSDEKLQGFYRVRRFKNAQDASQQKGMLSSQYVKFATMSQNPVSRTGADWVHPGIPAANVMVGLETWISTVFMDIILKIIDESIKHSMRSVT